MNNSNSHTKITNRRAFYDFHIGERFEAGIVLTGGEVKSVRRGQASLADSFVRIKNKEAYLVNMYVAPYQAESFSNNDPRRDRKLLLHKKQILSILGKMSGSNLTIVPVSCYNTHNLVKVELAFARGKKEYDKREAIKKKEEQREDQVLIRGKK